MGVISSDIIALKRGGTHYRTTAGEIAALATPTTIVDNLLSNSASEALSANQGRILKGLIDGIGDIQSTATIASRDALTGLDPGDLIHVIDDGDGKWARYQITSTTDGTWAASTSVKVGDQDWTGVAATNLAYTASPTQGVVTNTNGTGATLPLADGTNAGLLTPAAFTKLGFIAVTQAVDLDAIELASHAPVTLAGTSASNPLTLTGQVLGFDIGQLTAAP